MISHDSGEAQGTGRRLVEHRRQEGCLVVRITKRGWSSKALRAGGLANRDQTLANFTKGEVGAIAVWPR